MNLRLGSFLTAVTLVSPLVASAWTPFEDEPAKAAIADMSWLAGEWSGDMWGGRYEAYYTTPEGGMIISHSKLMKGEQESFYEFEVFESRDDGIYLQPFPGGRKAVGFDLVEHVEADRRAVFENPDKDYPTRIVYHRVSDDELVITLSDPHGGSDKTDRFALAR